MLERVYHAIRPSAPLSRVVDHLEAHARDLAGPRWAAIHLPVEKDWWWESDYCLPRAAEQFTRRCFTSLEVARITNGTRQQHAATGVVLLFAPNKVPWHLGPAICKSHYGGARVEKLILPTATTLDAQAHYTMKSAIELFFATRAPGGFFGNRFSTFSKGVALIRAATTRALGADPSSSSGGGSFAYDCAADAAVRSIHSAHPGFYHLRPVVDAHVHCRGDGSSLGNQTTLLRARRWWSAKADAERAEDIPPEHGRRENRVEF